MTIAHAHGTTFQPGDASFVGRWWQTVDRWMLAALIALLVVGALLMMAASPPSARRISSSLDSFHFARLQLMYLPVAMAVLISFSMLTPRAVRRLSAAGCAVFLALTLMTLFFGEETKGAQRWLSIYGHSLQPSEFLKPCFAVVAGWMLAEARLSGQLPGYGAATLLCLLIVALLAAQPDMGTAALVLAIWFSQIFLAGLPTVWVMGIGAAGLASLAGAYAMFDHVASRINAFLDPGSADNFQINIALEAFNSGGLFGRGPGEGIVKASLPDAHSDFILAVAGEELGLLACLAILALFAFVVLRGIYRLFGENNLFVVLSVTGLLTGFGLQAFINMASTLRMVPTKGITLPFISYGGSSMIALAAGMGMLLALSRRRRHGEAL